MNESLTLLLASFAGLLLGAIFFGGLWWTVQRALSAQQPALWFLGGLMMRMGIALAGFYVVADGHWERLLACLSGFVVARLAVTRMTRIPPSRIPPSRLSASATGTIRAP
jgi:F1F0 ATPase subunit 2